MPERKIYLLSPKELSPETIAVAFAKTSRSPETFREIADGLSDEASAKFNEKWVVGYGHASVAEHAVLHIALENISRLAVECIESNRLASYTEKSTRYQKWNADHFYTPGELTDRRLSNVYSETCKHLFEAYIQSLTVLKNHVVLKIPQKEKESDDAYDRRIRSAYSDCCRFLLPAASLANLGMTANARVLEHAIIKMLSHPLQEVQQIGQEIKKVAQSEVPTLVKYADVSNYMKELPGEWKSQKSSLDDRELSGYPIDWCKLIDYDPQGEMKILAALSYRFGSQDFSDSLDYIKALSQAELKALADSLVKGMGRFDIPLRELEHTTYTFDLTLDQGAFAEFKRHRMMTQTPQALTTRLGYVTPRLMVEAGFEREYRTAMEMAAETYEKLIEENPTLAGYVVPNGYNRRVLFTLNLREAFAFCRLRTAANAHFSIRRVACRIAEEIHKVHPLLTRDLVSEDETWQQIEGKYFC